MEISGQVYAPAALIPGQEPAVRIKKMRLGGDQSHCKKTGKRNNLLHLPQIEAIISHK
jgi:hypothetical protein